MFTVLQHVPEPDVLRVIDELRRIVRPEGWLLLCEETDASLEAGDRTAAHLGYTRGRPVDRYAEWLAPWTLVATRARVIEPGYPRPDVGTYMLFAGPRRRAALMMARAESMDLRALQQDRNRHRIEPRARIRQRHGAC